MTWICGWCVLIRHSNAKVTGVFILIFFVSFANNSYYLKHRLHQFYLLKKHS